MLCSTWLFSSWWLGSLGLIWWWCKLFRWSRMEVVDGRWQHWKVKWIKRLRSKLSSLAALSKLTASAKQSQNRTPTKMVCSHLRVIDGSHALQNTVKSWTATDIPARTCCCEKTQAMQNKARTVCLTRYWVQTQKGKKHDCVMTPKLGLDKVLYVTIVITFKDIP